MSDNAPVRPDSIGIFEPRDLVQVKREAAFSLFKKGMATEDVARALALKVGEARRFRQEWDAAKNRERIKRK